MPDCSHRRDDGERCGAKVGTEGEMCVFHDPARKAEAQAMRRRGAKTTNSRKKSKFWTADEDEVPPPPKTVEDAVAWASWAVHAVAVGKIDGRTGHEIGYVLRAFMDGRKHADKVDARVKELGDKIRQLKDAG